MDAFFIIEDGNARINEAIAFNIPIIKKIVRRDRGGMLDGDSDGRKKLFAIAELMYVWHMVNVNSPGNKDGLSTKELKQRAIIEAGLPDNWTPDALVIEFQEYYSKYHDTSVVKTIKQLLLGFSIIYDSNDMLIRFIKNAIKENQLTVDGIAELNKAQKEIMNTSASIPKLVEQLKIAQAEYGSVDNSLGKILGGGNLESSMIPNG